MAALTDEHIRQVWARELLRAATQPSYWDQLRPPRPPRSRWRRTLDWLLEFNGALAA